MSPSQPHVVWLYHCPDCELWCSTPCKDSEHHRRSFDAVRYVRVNDEYEPPRDADGVLLFPDED